MDGCPYWIIIELTVAHVPMFFFFEHVPLLSGLDEGTLEPTRYDPVVESSLDTVNGPRPIMMFN